MTKYAITQRCVTFISSNIPFTLKIEVLQVPIFNSFGKLCIF